nr:DUF2283 domain-containing protein [Micromonospora sp. DSM 115978]
MVPVRVTYDDRANAAYIYLQSATEGFRVAKTSPCDPTDVGGMINLDFDAAGRLIGIEVLNARAKLAPELLAVADDITKRLPDHR